MIIPVTCCPFYFVGHAPKRFIVQASFAWSTHRRDSAGTLASILAIALFASVASIAKDKNKGKREKSRKMATQTSEDLCRLQPTAQAAIQKSAGYAVFNNMGTNLLLVSAARGAGIAINSKTKQETFMKMISAGAGLGVGVRTIA